MIWSHDPVLFEGSMIILSLASSNLAGFRMQFVAHLPVLASFLVMVLSWVVADWLLFVSKVKLWESILGTVAVVEIAEMMMRC